MKITICGSMSFAKEMKRVQEYLKKRGHFVFTPRDNNALASGELKRFEGRERSRWKIEHDLIRGHYRLIKQSDAILVVNYGKNGIENYIGGNTFLEMGFAHVLGKKIYLLNDIPEIDLIRTEIEAMQPTILGSNLGLIKLKD